MSLLLTSQWCIKRLPSTSASFFHKSKMQFSRFRLKEHVSLFCIIYKIKTYIVMLCTRLILMELFDHESKNVYFYRPWPVWQSELENTMRTYSFTIMQCEENDRNSQLKVENRIWNIITMVRNVSNGCLWLLMAKG